MDLYYRRFCKSVRSGPGDFFCYWDRACVLRGMARSYKDPYRNNKKRVEENSRNQSDGCIFVHFRIVWGRYVHFCFPSDGVFGDRRVGYANTVHKNPGSCALECITGRNIWIRLSPPGSAWIYRHCFAVLSAYKIQLCFSSDQPGHYFCANGSFTVSSPVGQKLLDLIPFVGSSTDIFRTNIYRLFEVRIWSPYLPITVPIILWMISLPFAVRFWAKRAKN